MPDFGYLQRKSSSKHWSPVSRSPCLSCQTPLLVYSLSVIVGGRGHSQTLRMCRTVAALSQPLMREALIGCSAGRICSLNLAASNSPQAKNMYYRHFIDQRRSPQWLCFPARAETGNAINGCIYGLGCLIAEIKGQICPEGTCKPYPS